MIHSNFHSKSLILDKPRSQGVAKGAEASVPSNPSDTLSTGPNDNSTPATQRSTTSQDLHKLLYSPDAASLHTKELLIDNPAKGKSTLSQPLDFRGTSVGDQMAAGTFMKYWENMPVPRSLMDHINPKADSEGGSNATGASGASGSEANQDVPPAASKISVTAVDNNPLPTGGVVSLGGDVLFSVPAVDVPTSFPPPVPTGTSMASAVLSQNSSGALFYDYTPPAQ